MVHGRVGWIYYRKPHEEFHWHPTGDDLVRKMACLERASNLPARERRATLQEWIDEELRFLFGHVGKWRPPAPLGFSSDSDEVMIVEYRKSLIDARFI